uniref:Uncharacterized protein n=1 Tax=Micrurus lemniscatus lemniscatus TaxID=129467 RepID=A0A2D4I3U9_MICLE
MLFSNVTYLFPSIDDILSIGEPIDTWPANYRVMSGRGVGHFHGTKLQEGLPQCHTAKKHLSERREEEKNLKSELSYSKTFHIHHVRDLKFVQPINFHFKHCFNQ